MARHAQISSWQLNLLRPECPDHVNLCLHASYYSMPANTLTGWNANQFGEWLAKEGLEVEANTSRCVNFTHKQATEWLGNHSKSATANAINKALDIGYIVLIAKGCKGHPSLYYLPSPIVENSEYAPKTPNKARAHLLMDTPQEKTNTPQKPPEYAPNSPNKVCTTNNFTNNLTKENAQAGGAENTAPLVRLGDTCPQCKGHTGNPGTIKKLTEINPGVKFKDPSLLACPTCWAIFKAGGEMKSPGRYYR